MGDRRLQNFDTLCVILGKRVKHLHVLNAQTANDIHQVFSRCHGLLRPGHRGSGIVEDYYRNVGVRGLCPELGGNLNRRMLPVGRN
jgi:hypothetical protein